MKKTIAIFALLLVLCGCSQSFTAKVSGSLSVYGYDDAITVYNNILSKAQADDLIIVDLNIKYNNIDGNYLIDYGLIPRERFKHGRICKTSPTTN